MSKIYKYPDEVLEWVKVNVEGKDISSREAAEMFNRSELSERIGIKMTQEKMLSFLRNHKIRNEWVRKGKSFGPRIFPEGLDDFLRERADGVPFPELTNIVNEHYGTAYTYKQILRYAKNKKIKNNVDTRIKPGNVPPNKGRKGYCSPGSEKGWFKKGNLPPKHLPVGTEVVDTDGYLKVKIGEPHYWIYSHRLIWMREHGDMPDGCIVIFLDGDKTNLKPENLRLIAREEHVRLNQNQWRFSNRELTDSAVNLVRLNAAILKKGGRKKRGRGSEVHILREEAYGSGEP